MSGTHGAIHLVEDRCTSCMICARECPVWCISIASHTEPDPAQADARRPRLVNVLDDFSIDWSVCMYCGICIDECPFDALQWSEAHLPAGETLAALVQRRAELAPPPGDAS